MDDSPTMLRELAAQVLACERCQLCRARTHAVPGEGPAAARIMLIGEGPGQQEDASGRPFVGPAGQLLDHLILRAGLRRPEVFITNIVKCRPPANRDPLPGEVAACRPYLDAQIALLNPSVVGLLGRQATQALLDPEASISRVHGRVFEKDGLVYLPLYHPAAGLRQASLQPAMIADLQQLAQTAARFSGGASV
jgi:DNA polymerase